VPAMQMDARSPIGASSYSRTAWLKNSANFAFWAFSEVRNTKQRASNTKDSPFGGCAVSYKSATLHLLRKGRSFAHSRPTRAKEVEGTMRGRVAALVAFA
jgi:hypothetical protein